MWVIVRAEKYYDNRREPLFSVCCTSVVQVVEAVLRGISYGKDVKIMMEGDWGKND